MVEAKGFTDNYYKTFDANRVNLVNMCGEESFLDFEGQEIKGKEAIVARLTSLQQCRYQILKIDHIPSGAPGGVLVVVSSYMWLDGKQDALVFNQTFHLMPAPEGSFYVAQHLWITAAFNQRQTPSALPMFPSASPMSRMELLP
ncbi:hypothetical protein BT93_F2533 [Corymbia citriodora subsp. variegata]|nr:hypothetical protein BT93_F2533 [Corymbia citriodora subsp. variegata]